MALKIIKSQCTVCGACEFECPNAAIKFKGDTYIIGAAPTSALLLDCSTIDVDTARAVAGRAREAGYAFADAPVSGGTMAADAGTLAFMVGCDEDQFARIEAALAPMSRATFRAGDHGAGQAAKICNNMILGATMIATCEAFALADKLGLDRQKMFDVVSTSSGYSWSMNAYCPAPGVGPKSPADNDYKPGFASELMLKDLRLSQQALAEMVGLSRKTVNGLLAEFAREGLVDLDYGGLAVLDLRRLQRVAES